MKLAYDLHIHSALSPCAENHMTPNNIINMSLIKGLDVIAVTDHNSCRNVSACIACAKGSRLLVIPGMEVETAEEIHVICLFPEMKRALKMQDIVYSNLPNFKNNVSIFGQQLILKKNDKLKSVEERLLLTSTAITINEIFEIVLKLGGAAIPAHIDRYSNSLLSSFGVFPQDLTMNCVECSDENALIQLQNKHPGLQSILKVYSSDAHYLGHINERKYFLEVDCRSTAEIIKVLNGKK